MAGSVKKHVPHRLRFLPLRACQKVSLTAPNVLADHCQSYYKEQVMTNIIAATKFVSMFDLSLSTE